MATDRMLFGDHKRAVIYKGPPNFQEILKVEIAGEYIELLPGIQEECGEVLVMGKSSQIYGRML